MSNKSRIAGTVTISGLPAVRDVIVIKDDPTGREVVAEGTSLSDGTFDIEYNDWTGPVIALALDEYGISFVPESSLNAGDVVHPTSPNGYVYNVTVAGETGEEEPAWSTSEIVQSGSVTFNPSPYYRPIASGPLQGDSSFIDIIGDLVGGAINESYSVILNSEGATAPVVWSVSGGDMPDGWGIDPDTGELGGVATGGMGEYMFTVQAVDGEDKVGSREFTVSIGEVKSLLHFDGANNSTTFTDQSGKTWSAFGDAKISTSVTVFDQQSVLFDGSGDYISTPHSADLALDIDCTIDCWLYWAEDPARLNTIITKRSSASGGVIDYVLAISAAGKLEVAAWAVGGVLILNIVSTTTIPKNVSTHIALSRRGNDWKLFINGQVEASGTQSGTYGAGTYATVVARDPRFTGTRDFNGRIDELRITRGATRYWEEFTPPTLPSDFPVVP